ncbi:MAG: hypothetical protein RQ715_07120 [Methylococcales bacterium]|nr:hypothetical protein [Methylococcales bacterium]
MKAQLARLFNRKPRILCLVPHYFGQQSAFVGKSTRSGLEQRQAIVKQTLQQLNTLPHCEVKACGIEGQSAIVLDWLFDCPDPRLLVYEVIYALEKKLPDYDYFMVVEDDILVPAATVHNILAFDRHHPKHYCLHPNRLEIDRQGKKCIDLLAMPGWLDATLTFHGKTLQTAVNPHSAFMMLSRAKLAMALSQIDTTFKGIIVGGYMASAFAHIHSPFQLFRCRDDLDFHHVIHLDHWLNPEDLALPA